MKYRNLDRQEGRNALYFTFQQMLENKIVEEKGKLSIDDQKILFMESHLFLALSGTLHFIGAFDKDNLVGLIGYQEDTISILYVLKQYQRRGIATRLLKQALDNIKKSKNKVVFLYSTEMAIPFYQENGFQKENTEVKKYTKMLRML